MILAYNLLFVILLILYVPVLFLRRKWHAGFWTRWGSSSLERLRRYPTQRIWVHAVSVGEVLVLRTLLNALHQEYPRHPIVLTVVTKTGYEVAKSLAGDRDEVLYAPFDLSWVVRRYIHAIQPAIFLNTETEFWPNLLIQLFEHKIPIVQMNGRISDRSFVSYRRFRRFLKPVIATATCFCMQTQQDAERVKYLGACAERVHVTGNMKFDDLLSPEKKKAVYLSKDPGTMMLTAASTHPGEEEAILQIFSFLRVAYPQLRLLIAPRHPERTEQILTLCERMNFQGVRLSASVDTVWSSATVFIVDTIGQLRFLYRYADIVFVGKSLSAHGGQNMIEPAREAKPIIVGPFTENFRDVVEIFLSKHAILQVKNQQELQRAVVQLIEDPSLRESLGKRARQVVESQAGATPLTLAHIIALLGSSS